MVVSPLNRGAELTLTVPGTFETWLERPYEPAASYEFTVAAPKWL